MRIRKKICIAISIVIILTISIFAGITLDMEKRNVVLQRCEEQKMYLDFYVMEFESILEDSANPDRILERSALESYTINAIKNRQNSGFLRDLVKFRNIKYALYDEEGQRYWYNNSEFDLHANQEADYTSKQIILNNDGKHYILSCQKLTRGDFSVYTLTDISDAYVYLMKLRLIIIATGVALCTITVLVIYLVVGKVLSSLKLLEKHVQKVGTGEYEERIEIHSKDEMEELADCFNDMTDKLAQTMEEKEQEIQNRELLIHALSHELKTPLTSMKGCAQTLLLTKLSEEQQEDMLVMMDKECSRLEKLSQKMMKLLIVKSMDRQGFTDCDVKQLLKDVKSATETVYPDKHLTITTEADCEVIYGEADLLYELISNLTDNAAKACSENGNITITVQENVLTVQDDGVGIKEENLSNIMLPFFMEDKSRSRKNNGVGLGLAICAKIVELHEMRLEVASTPGKGTRIMIYNLFTK